MRYAPVAARALDALEALRRKVRGHGRDVGISTVELVILAPIFMSLVLLVVTAGRVQDAGVRVTGAARDGARAASLERTQDAAAEAARQAVRANMTGQGVGCAGGPIITVSTSAFTAGGRVDVTVRCTTDLGDVAVPGLPGSATLTKRASSPIETYRSVQ